jgi:TfoX/Sxy family transcriptional regulator of competence genes
MSSDQSFVEFISDQMGDAGTISFRKMFGEYAIYCDAKVIGLICDNKLFIKPTEKGRKYIGEVAEAPPYPGAKLYFLIESEFEDREWISDLVRITADNLPLPKKKNNKTVKNIK